MVVVAGGTCKAGGKQLGSTEQCDANLHLHYFMVYGAPGVQQVQKNAPTTGTMPQPYHIVSPCFALEVWMWPASTALCGQRQTA
jgi:hypothetical protein